MQELLTDIREMELYVFQQDSCIPNSWDGCSVDKADSGVPHIGHHTAQT